MTASAALPQDRRGPAGTSNADVRIIGVRGSTEPQGGSRLLKPIGQSIAGSVDVPASYEELRYPATIDRFDPPADIDLGESPAIGVRNLLVLLDESASRHPARRFVLLGYSQGAQVIGDALVSPEHRTSGLDAGELSGEVADRIVAVILFGDPGFTRGEPFNAGTFDPEKEGLDPRPPGALDAHAGRLRSYCARGDVTCQGRGGSLQAHGEYFTNGMPADAVAFARQRLANHTRES